MNIMAKDIINTKANCEHSVHFSDNNIFLLWQKQED